VGRFLQLNSHQSQDFSHAHTVPGTQVQKGQFF